ncbi:ATP-binding protein [uncultured Stenotrophomonas sp.]|uniref:AAA family ATPase n=1 Tax=uncultured Stenotrophomonas sp. TaxID=165438 RepID=UPI0025FAD761|nr:ATP-binding protein [uncultured Stenotrophomonas sp.]
MARPLLTSFRIRGYRGIRDLEIPHLGRVNLIVGKNSCGKTSILEAVQLYAGNANLGGFFAVMAARKEPVRLRVRDYDQLQEFYQSFRNLFYQSIDEEGDPHFVLSSADDSLPELFVNLTHMDPGVSVESIGLQRDLITFSDDDFLRAFALHVNFGSRLRTYPFEISESYAGSSIKSADDFEFDRSVFVTSAGLSEERMGRMWDSISLTDLEEDVLSALRLILPGVERISLVQGGGRDRHFMIRSNRFPRPMPLRVLGDGVARLMGVALALVSAKNGILIIDEIENGLHFSVQQSVWKLIFEAAARLNVQVFAATHSWDCIKSFERAASTDQNEDAYLFRIQDSKKGVRMITFNESELAIAAKQGIEVR